MEAGLFSNHVDVLVCLLNFSPASMVVCVSVSVYFYTGSLHSLSVKLFRRNGGKALTCKVSVSRVDRWER